LNLREKKRLAARLLKVGVSRVRFDPDSAEDIEDAITKNAMRSLINKGKVWSVPAKGVSKGRHRVRAVKVRRRGRGPGSKKGAKTARMGKKLQWIIKVRSMRRRLKMWRDRGDISKDGFKALYGRIKSGQVRDLKHLEEQYRAFARGTRT